LTETGEDVDLDIDVSVTNRLRDGAWIGDCLEFATGKVKPDFNPRRYTSLNIRAYFKKKQTVGNYKGRDESSMVFLRALSKKGESAGDIAFMRPVNLHKPPYENADVNLEKEVRVLENGTRSYKYTGISYAIPLLGVRPPEHHAVKTLRDDQYKVSEDRRPKDSDEPTHMVHVFIAIKTNGFRGESSPLFVMRERSKREMYTEVLLWATGQINLLGMCLRLVFPRKYPQHAAVAAVETRTLLCFSDREVVTEEVSPQREGFGKAFTKSIIMAFSRRHARQDEDHVEMPEHRRASREQGLIA